MTTTKTTPADWADLTDDDRDQLVSTGAVKLAVPTVVCTAAETWEADWRAESQAAWPTYTLAISADGMETLHVAGWHVVGPGAARNRLEWGQEDSDGYSSGLPRVDGWEVRPGAHVGEAFVIPCWRDDAGQWCTLDRDALTVALEDAAAEADHGGEPTWEDVPVAGMETGTTVSVLVAGEVVEVEILHGGLAPHDREDYALDGRLAVQTDHHCEAWSHGLGDDQTWETREEALADLAGRTLDDEVHADDEAATVALARLAEERHGPLAGLATGDGHTWVTPTSVVLIALDADEAAEFYSRGWSALADRLGDSGWVVPDNVRAAARLGLPESAMEGIDTLWLVDDDRTAALVLADWLDEQSDPRGEAIRCWVEMADLRSGDRWRQLRTRWRQIVLGLVD